MFALEMRPEELEVRRSASLDPDRVGLGGRARLLLAQLDRDAELLLAVVRVARIRLASSES